MEGKMKTIERGKSSLKIPFISSKIEQFSREMPQSSTDYSTTIVK